MKWTEGHAKIIYGNYMTPCAKCGSWHFRPQTPIVLKEELPKDFTPKQLVNLWKKSIKEGNTPLEGPCFFMCVDCGHKGPAVDCSGLTEEHVRKDPIIYAEMKRLWNEEKS